MQSPNELPTLPRPTARSLSIAFVACFAYLAAAATRPIGIYDEGISVFGGYRVLHGEAPYRDFWTWYAPGIFYWNALLIRVFGESLWVTRLADCAVRAIICTLVYSFAIRLSNRRAAALACAAAAIWLGQVGNFGYNAVPAALIALLAVQCVARFSHSQGDHARLPLLAGMLCGATAVFRHDIAVYVSVACFVALSTFLLATRRLNSAYASARRTLVAFIGGGLLTGLPLLFAVTRLAPLGQLLNDLVKMPPTLMRPYRAVAMPPPLPDPRPLLQGSLSPGGFAIQLFNGLEHWVPLAALLCALFWSARRWRDRTKPSSVFWTALPLFLASVCTLAFAAARTDLPHLLPSTIFVIPLAAGVGHSIFSRVRRKWLAGIAMFGLLGATLIHPAYVHARLALLPLTAPPGEFAFDCPRARGICVPTDYAKLVANVAGCVPLQERIYVGFTDHARVWNNDLMLYFLVGRLSSTRILDLHPGVITSQPVQEATIEELKRFNVGTIVLLDQAVNEALCQPRTPEPGGNTLDRYIRARYHKVTRIGAYEIWQSDTDVTTESPNRLLASPQRSP